MPWTGKTWTIESVAPRAILHTSAVSKRVSEVVCWGHQLYNRMNATISPLCMRESQPLGLIKWKCMG